MSGFKELNEHINKTMTYILESENICKLLTYNTKDVLSQPIIEDNSNLIMNNLFPFMFVPENDIEDKKTIISVLLEDFSRGDSVVFKKGFITINVICHKDLWLTSDGLRPFLIMEELDKKFNKFNRTNNRNNIGLGGSSFESANHCWFSKDYSGYSVRYKAIDFN
jgi:hypothetical protein